MKTLLFLLLTCGVIVSCGKTDLPTPINKPTEDMPVVELTGSIFVNGLPLLKKIDDSENGITEYFYDESKRAVRITSDKSPFSETRYKYKGDLMIERNLTKNPNYLTPNPQFLFNTDPSYYEYDNQGRVAVSKSVSYLYSFSYDGNSVTESSKSLVSSNSETRISANYKYDIKGNLIEFSQEGQLNEYTYDDKIKPNSFNPSNNTAHPLALSKNNVLTEKVSGGWFGNSYTTYTYTYNKYGLPITSTSDKGKIITYTYYE